MNPSESKPTISPSGMRLYNECSQAYHYAYVQGLQRKGATKRYMDIGTYYHELQHVHNQLLQLGHEPGSDFIINAMRSRIERDSADLTTENLDIYARVWPLTSKFISYQSPKIDVGITPLGIEYEFHVDIGITVLHGIIDLFYSDPNGNLILRDHKTSTNKNAWTQEKLMMNGQQIFYLLALSILFDRPVLTSEINFANTYEYKTKQIPLDETFRAFRYTHNEHMLETFKRNVIETVEKILDNNPRRVYNDRCNSCQFFQICHLESRGLPIKHLLASNYESRSKRDSNTNNRSQGIQITNEDTKRRSTPDIKVQINFPRRQLS